MYIDDKGLVLRTVKYDDKSFIAHIFTASRGHAAFMINGSRGKRSGTSARLFQPLSFLSFQWDAKPTATLHRMKEARLLFTQQDIPYHPTKRCIAMLLAEFMTHALTGETENAHLYIYVEHSVQWLDVVHEGYANFHLVFLLKLARFLGIAPNTEDYVEGCGFDLTRGRFTTMDVPSNELLCSADATLLYRLSDASYATMDIITMNRHDRARLINHLARYYALHIPSFPAIKSLEVLQEVMG